MATIEDRLKRGIDGYADGLAAGMRMATQPTGGLSIPQAAPVAAPSGGGPTVEAGRQRRIAALSPRLETSVPKLMGQDFIEQNKALGGSLAYAAEPVRQITDPVATAIGRPIAKAINVARVATDPVANAVGETAVRTVGMFVPPAEKGIRAVADRAASALSLTPSAPASVAAPVARSASQPQIASAGIGRVTGINADEGAVAPFAGRTVALAGQPMSAVGSAYAVRPDGSVAEVSPEQAAAIATRPDAALRPTVPMMDTATNEATNARNLAAYRADTTPEAFASRTNRVTALANTPTPGSARAIGERAADRARADERFRLGTMKDIEAEKGRSALNKDDREFEQQKALRQMDIDAKPMKLKPQDESLLKGIDREMDTATKMYQDATLKLAQDNTNVELKRLADEASAKMKDLQSRRDAVLAQYGEVAPAQVPQSDIPVMTPEQAKKLPKGSKFKTADGRIMTRS